MISLMNIEPSFNLYTNKELEFLISIGYCPAYISFTKFKDDTS